MGSICVNTNSAARSQAPASPSLCPLPGSVGFWEKCVPHCLAPYWVFPTATPPIPPVKVHWRTLFYHDAKYQQVPCLSLHT